MKLRTLYTARDIELAVHRLAEEISRDLTSLLPAPDAGDSPGKGKKDDRRSGSTASATGLTPYPEVVGLRGGARATLEPTFSFERPLLVGLLKGTFMFLADLARSMRIPVDIDFMRARRSPDSAGGTSVEFEYEPQHSLEGRTVVVVEDVAGTGRTLPSVLARLEAHNPRTIRVCALVRRRGYSGPTIDYVGFNVGPGWLVGYGLDDREALRNLPCLCVLED